MATLTKNCIKTYLLNFMKPSNATIRNNNIITRSKEFRNTINKEYKAMKIQI